MHLVGQQLTSECRFLEVIIVGYCFTLFFLLELYQLSIVSGKVLYVRVVGHDAQGWQIETP